MRNVARTNVVAAALALLLPFGPAAYAQSPTPPKDLVNPSTVSFNHDGKNVKGFAAYIVQDGKVMRRVDLGALRPDRNGRIVARVPPLPAGAYSIEVSAYNDAGESAHVRAEPAIFRVTESSSESDKPTDRVTSDQQPPQPKPPDGPEPKRKKGFLGKVLGAVVGSDDDGD